MVSLAIPVGLAVFGAETIIDIWGKCLSKIILPNYSRLLLKRQITRCFCFIFQLLLLKLFVKNISAFSFK
jgi:hypothetical protein